MPRINVSLGLGGAQAQVPPRVVPGAALSLVRFFIEMLDEGTMLLWCALTLQFRQRRRAMRDGNRAAALLGAPQQLRARPWVAYEDPGHGVFLHIKNRSKQP